MNESSVRHRLIKRKGNSYSSKELINTQNVQKRGKTFYNEMYLFNL